MAPHTHALPDLNRRRFLTGVGVAAAAGAVSPMLLASPAQASHNNRSKPWPADPLPEPIPGSVPSGDPNVGDIHWWLPGPVGAVTPIIGLEAFGLDVDPSLMTDFEGFQAFAVVSGTTTRSDGSTHPTEFDVRVFQGNYVAADGKTYYGTFGFF